MSFDSAVPSKKEADPNQTSPFHKIPGSTLRLGLTAEGTVREVIGHSAWLATVVGKEPGPEGELISQQFSESFVQQLADFGRAFPPGLVAVGQSWPYRTEVRAGALGKIVADTTVSLARWEDHEQHRFAVLESKGTLKGVPDPDTPGDALLSLEEGSVSGRSWFDPELGALVESVVEQTMRLSGEAAAPPGVISSGATFITEIGQRVTVKLVQ
jgi:hypothetical protein